MKWKIWQKGKTRHLEGDTFCASFLSAAFQTAGLQRDISKRLQVKSFKTKTAAGLDFYLLNCPFMEEKQQKRNKNNTFGKAEEKKKSIFYKSKDN